MEAFGGSEMNKFESEPINISGQNIEGAKVFVVPRDNRGRIRWIVLNETPEVLKTFIETEASNALSAGIEIRYKTLIQSRRGHIYKGAKEYYPGGLQGLRINLGLASEADRKPRGGWDNPELIREEARKILESEGSISHKTLKKKKRSDLEHAIQRHYPGKTKQLRIDLGISPKIREVKSPRIRKIKEKTHWGKMTQAEIVATIRTQANEFFTRTGRLSSYALTKENMAWLSAAVLQIYPGGIRQLRSDLGIGETRKQDGYWSKESIEKEVSEFIDKHGDFSHKLLRKLGRPDLSCAIQVNYPGRTSALRKNLGIAPGNKPKGFWSSETTMQQAKQFLKTHGDLNTSLLKDTGSSALLAAIQKHHPGGLLQLRTDLGLDSRRRPNGYWTPDRIEETALEFYKSEGKLTTKLLKERGHILTTLISTSYPGGMNALKRKLGIEFSVYPAGYWTTEKIEHEAKLFLDSGGRLTENDMTENGRSDLAYIVRRYYPGRMRGLRGKLGALEPRDKFNDTSMETAQEDLWKLLEV